MSPMPLPPVNFLIVDDLDENLLALEALLRRDGLNILKACSGAEALELLLQFDVGLAILDVQMPGMDGFELAELMRGTDRTRRVPIIFLTAGNADRRRRFRGYEAGAVDFLHKPVEPDILRSKTEVFFDLYRQRQEVANHRDELQAATEENHRLLNESRRQAAELLEADRRKDEFLAVLAHELRNPLAPVRSAIEILMHTEESNQVAAEARAIISRQVTHMSRLIDDLLDVARIARGKVQLRNEQCDVAEITRQTAEDYRSTLNAANVALEVNVERKLPIYGDQTRLAQVIGNLLHNAAKFTPAGGRVSVRAAKNSDGRTMSVAVEDNGIGLAAEVMESLFTPFSQAEQGVDRSNGGLGLGLALAKGIVELHGGAIRVESDGPGQGSTFTIELPILHSNVESPKVEKSLPHHADRKRRILIVEDNGDAARSLQMLLKLMGFDVDVASNGLAGVEAVRSHRPDVVMSDIGLPGEIDGYSLARMIRADDELSAIRLIAISGYGQQQDREQSQQAGFDRHLVKPVDLTQLKLALDSVL